MNKSYLYLALASSVMMAACVSKDVAQSEAPKRSVASAAAARNVWANKDESLK